MPDPQKLNEIINGSSFKVICYSATDNLDFGTKKGCHHYKTYKMRVALKMSSGQKLEGL